MIRVLLANSYSMEFTYDLWKKGKGGSHHVWGKVELEKDSRIEMKILKHERYKFLDKIGSFFGIRHLDQQVRILLMQNEFDIIYAPYSTANTKLLLYLKWLGIFRKPMVVAIHQPFLGTNSSSGIKRKLSKSLLLTYDAAIFLSEALKDQTIFRLGISNRYEGMRIFTAQWGPEEAFYKRLPSISEDDNDPFLISAGLTSRDYNTLIEAFRKLPYKLVLYCTDKSLDAFQDLPPNVILKPDFVPYHELLNEYQQAKAVLIPLKYPLKKQGCQGMTSLQDVIALSKPVIITETPTLNLDVELEGIGISVPMGDVEGWVLAVKRIMENESERKQMIENTKEIFRHKFNARIYSERLGEIISYVYEKKEKGIDSKRKLIFTD